MNSGKSKSSRKTREPYGKVTEVGQVPIALQEIRELAIDAQKIPDPESVRRRLEKIHQITDSIIAVTCANPGCLSQMAEQMEASDAS